MHENSEIIGMLNVFRNALVVGNGEEIGVMQDGPTADKLFPSRNGSSNLQNPIIPSEIWRSQRVLNRRAYSKY